MSYRIEFDSTAVRDLRKLPAQRRELLEPSFLALAMNPRPRGVRKIAGEDSSFRIRVGQYRIIFEIDDSRRLIVVLRVRRRDE